jgi:hypothetical protein
VIFDDVARKHHIGVRHVDDDVTRRMRTPEMHQVDPALAKEDGHLIGEGGRWPGEAGNFLVSLKQSGKAAKLGVPVFLPRSATIARALLPMMIWLGAKRGRSENSHGVIVGQHDMGDRLVGY